MSGIDLFPATLRELRDKIENILDADGVLVDGATGEILTAQDLDALEAAWDAKVNGVAITIKNLRANAAAHAAQAKAQKEMADAETARAEWLEKYLYDRLDGKAFESPEAKITWRKSEAVSVTEIGTLPESFLRVKLEADKTAIKKALKAGEAVAGAELIVKNNMQVK